LQLARPDSLPYTTLFRSQVVFSEAQNKPDERPTAEDGHARALHLCVVHAGQRQRLERVAELRVGGEQVEVTDVGEDVDGQRRLGERHNPGVQLLKLLWRNRAGQPDSDNVAIFVQPFEIVWHRAGSPSSQVVSRGGVRGLQASACAARHRIVLVQLRRWQAWLY